MTHYDVSSHLRTIVNVWNRMGDNDAYDRTLLDGEGHVAQTLYTAAESLARAMMDVALPDAVDIGNLPPWPAGSDDGSYDDPVLGLMAFMVNDMDGETLFFPIAEFCERYGLQSRMVELSEDDSDTGKACQLLEERGNGDALLRVWRPPYESGEVCILRQYGEDGPYVVFAREKAVESEVA